ncbi:class I SAM-dependent methyltransferase [Sphingomonas quercus]|uniref:Class I SAM-dependent methyltransferase n=1 Tax=Sphingomonas quercus TaxID=2842451 RepID=A0ABS6BKH0_9SPHN|nr:class I SAM-dependent methyltransferase [Sphingomonas quercus]MBU3078664.1 class I SAM-dependent methyltransferase [Sphingomonas quercus]
MKTSFKVVGDTYICRVPVEMLFCESNDFIHGPGKYPDRPPLWHQQHGITDGLSILSLRSHVRLFEGFFDPSRLDVGYYENWWNATHRTMGVAPPRDAARQIFERYDYFNHLNARYAENGVDDDAFLLDGEYDAATGRFILRDGHHRASYLIGRRQRWANVRMSPRSFGSLFEPSIGARVRRHVEQIGYKEPYSPIEHPQFHIPFAHRDNFFPNRLGCIADTLGYIRPASVLDIGCNAGYFSRHFSRLGAQVVGVEPQDSHFTTASILNELFNTQCDFRQDTAESVDLGSQVFDMAIVLTVLYHFLDRGDTAVKIAKKIDNHVSDFLFWESGSDIAREIDFMNRHTGFGAYRRLRMTIGTGRVRELGIFARNADAIDSLLAFNPYRPFLAG